MVVVMLVAILAALATPSFSEARNDRVAFDYARQYQQILAQARARAAGTGSAHLALLTGGSGGNGSIRLYAALDGVTPTSTPAGPGPNPVSSCKFNPLQWNAALSDTDYRIDRVLSNNTLRFIDYADINRGGINVDMGLRAQLRMNGGAVDAIAVCITPSGVTYVGSGGAAADAIAAMRASTPFTGTAEVRIQRHRGTTAVGLERIVQIAGGATPRLRAQ